MSSPDPPDGPDEEAASRGSGDERGEWWVDRFILYSARESMLWALLFVVLAHFAVFIASVVLAALRTLHPLAIAMTVAIVVGTGWGVRAEIQRKGKLAGLTWLLLATWLLSGAAAYLGARLELL